MKNIKKILVVFIVMGLLVACGGASSGKQDVSIGLGSSQSATVNDEGSEATFNTVVVGVAIVDGKISYVAIDNSEQKAKLANDKLEATVALTKKQKGADYGLLSASQQSGLGKEWMDQIAGVEEGLVGKTIEEATAYFAGEEILTAATIGLSDVEIAFNKAVDNLVGVVGVSEVGLGYFPSVDLKNDDTKVSVNLDYAMLALEDNGKIVSVALDTAEEVAEVVDGKIVTTNINKTKTELGKDYGMIVASGINKEWFEQVEFLEDFLVGKTIDEVNTINDFAGEDEDLKTSVTFNISGLKAAINNAKENIVKVK